MEQQAVVIYNGKDSIGGLDLPWKVRTCDPKQCCCSDSHAALHAIQSITYKFIWGNQREVSWENMAKPKRQGGLSVRDYKASQQAAIIDRTYRIWENKGIWSDWMCRRYGKERSFGQIVRRQGDSANWKATLRQGEHITKCVELGTHYSKRWIGKRDVTPSKMPN